MNIATALNKKYIKYTVVMLTSLCANNFVHIDAYILHSELTDDDITLMRNSMEAYDIALIPIKINDNKFDERFPRTSMWSIETYYRLFLLDYLPESVDRLLYLDVDLIINKNIEEFYNVDFGTDEIIACEDSLGDIGFDKRSEKQQQMFKAMAECGFKYFNAGVMLMNIALLRKKYSFSKYMEVIEEWNFEMTAPDQDILNYAHWNKLGYVDAYEYDLFARMAHNKGITYADAKNNARIIHFTGQKPWNSEFLHFDIEKLWWDYAGMTVFYGELLESFLEEIFTNTDVEIQFNALMGEVVSNRKQIEELMQANERLTKINKETLAIMSKLTS